MVTKEMVKIFSEVMSEPMSLYLSKEHKLKHALKTVFNFAFQEKRLKRMWVNQPSLLQEHHQLHGTNVLVQHPYRGQTEIALVYFTSGSVVSQEIPYNCLSKGWLNHWRNM